MRELRKAILSAHTTHRLVGGAFTSNDNHLHVQAGLHPIDFAYQHTAVVGLRSGRRALVAEVSGAPQVETSVPLAIVSEATGIAVVRVVRSTLVEGPTWPL